MTAIDDTYTPATMLVDLTPSDAERRSLARAGTAVAAIALGHPVLLVGTEQAPTRGEIVFAASRAAVESTAFAVRHSSGFLQVALPAQRCVELGLVAQRGADAGILRQCVTVDAANGVGTGISAADRAATARLLAHPDATAESFTRPGHVVPLRADLHHPASEFGFAEAAVTLVMRSGDTGAAAVLATVIGVDNDTTLAAGHELREFARDHRLPIVAIDDLAVDLCAPAFAVDTGVQLAADAARLMSFDEHIVLAVGDVRGAGTVPVHIVAMDRVLLEANAHTNLPRVVVGVTEASARQRFLDRALTDGDIVRAALRATGARSIRAFAPGVIRSCAAHAPVPQRLLRR
ncbi:MAG TPA: 3,4-dihydroxy-2-butanone-4-phosphate synthase [Aldersonia sp.]